MLTLIIAIIGNVYATDCDTYAPSAYASYDCNAGYDVCGTNNTHELHLECKIQGGADSANSSVVAVYNGGDYYIYGATSDGDKFCCDSDTISNAPYGAWTSVSGELYSEWYGSDGTGHTDTIDLSGWTGNTLVYSDNDPGAGHTTGGSDTVYGVNESANSDEIHGGPGLDKIDGGAGGDDIYGDAGWDQLCGGDDNDHLWGGADQDNIFGGAGWDVMDGGTTTSPFSNHCEAAVIGGVKKNTVLNCPGSVLIGCPF